MTLPKSGSSLEAGTASTYRNAIQALTKSGPPFLVGGAYAYARYAGIERHTKDFDVFIRPDDIHRALSALGDAGFQTELTFPHWLGKAFSGDDYIDVIFSSGNGTARVDEQWFEHSITSDVLGLPVRLCPAEEMIWSKAYVMERERYDGADIAHLLRVRSATLDWDRLLARFEAHAELLLSILLLFGFVYPDDRACIPPPVIQTLIDRVREEFAASPEHPPRCRGTLLSRLQYLVDVSRWGYRDARLPPLGHMTAEQIAHWTAAGLQEG
jgi:hypothetical protein